MGFTNWMPLTNAIQLTNGFLQINGTNSVFYPQRFLTRRGNTLNRINGKRLWNQAFSPWAGEQFNFNDASCHENGCPSFLLNGASHRTTPVQCNRFVVTARPSLSTPRRSRYKGACRNSRTPAAKNLCVPCADPRNPNLTQRSRRFRSWPGTLPRVADGRIAGAGDDCPLLAGDAM